MHDTLRFRAQAVESTAWRLWPSVISTVALWHERSRSRRHLALLDDRALADIGLSRAGQWQESRKRFWQV
jgi:uncharacterized protein YjiS (DUF1127 family)